MCRWEGGGGREKGDGGECSVNGGDGEKPFFENIDRRNCNDGSRELIPVFHNPHRKRRPSPSAVAMTHRFMPIRTTSFQLSETFL